MVLEQALLHSLTTLSRLLLLLLFLFYSSGKGGRKAQYRVTPTMGKSKVAAAMALVVVGLLEVLAGGVC